MKNNYNYAENHKGGLRSTVNERFAQKIIRKGLHECISLN